MKLQQKAIAMSSKYKNILFRSDSSSKIGTGHIMRDLVLANKYKNSNIIFATQDLKGNINQKIIEANHKIEILNSNKISELLKIIKKYKIDMIVIDHYDIDYKFEKKLKEKTNMKILSFDDTYEKHHSDILLNHNISGNKKKYEELVPKNCEIKCGIKYTLLREEFKKEKLNTYKENKKFTFFIAMGGADTKNLNIKILKLLKNFNNIKINLVTTNANKNLLSLKKYCLKKKNISLYINSNNIAKIMKKSDLAIITPSVTLNEVYFMNLKFIAIKTAKNQIFMYQFLLKNNSLALKEFNKTILLTYINKFNIKTK